MPNFDINVDKRTDGKADACIATCYKQAQQKDHIFSSETFRFRSHKKCHYIERACFRNAIDFFFFFFFFAQFATFLTMGRMEIYDLF